MRRQGDAEQKQDGYGRMPNSVVKSSVWAKLHPKMKAVYGALLGLLNRNMAYADTQGTWRVAYGLPTLKGIARASGVRAADVPRITDLLEELDLIIKTPQTINRKRRMRYIIRPPEHPIYSRTGETCERIYIQVGRGWGLTRKWGSRKKTHESPTRLQTHESPTRLHFTHIHRAKKQKLPVGDQSVRRVGGPPAQGSAPRSASPPHPHLPLTKFRWSQSGTAREEKGDVGLLASYFTKVEPGEWERHARELEKQGYRLRTIEEAMSIATGISPHLPSPDGGSPENERRLCHGVTQNRSACVLKPLSGSHYCRHHKRHAEKA